MSSPVHFFEQGDRTAIHAGALEATRYDPGGFMIVLFRIQSCGWCFGLLRRQEVSEVFDILWARFDAGGLRCGSWFTTCVG